MLKLKNVYILLLTKISKSLSYIIMLNIADFFFRKISKHSFSQHNYQKTWSVNLDNTKENIYLTLIS